MDDSRTRFETRRGKHHHGLLQEAWEATCKHPDHCSGMKSFFANWGMKPWLPWHAATEGLVSDILHPSNIQSIIKWEC